MVEFDLEWADNGPDGVDLPPFIEAYALPYVGTVITWVVPSEDGPELVEVSAEVVDIEMNVFEEHRGLYTVYVKPVD